MNRKWAIQAVVTFASALIGGGFSLAQEEDESPLHKIMEKVQSNNGKITKGVRNAVSYKKSQKDVAAAAEDLVKLAKEAKPLNEIAKKTEGVEDAVAMYDGFSNDFIKEAEDFSKLVSNADTTQTDAKAGYKKVTKTCTACHDVFRPEE